MDDQSQYATLALGAIDRTAVRDLLARHGAIVLERLARGGGATRWYLIQYVEQLDLLAKELAPGSSVSFYFDGRIEAGPIDDSVVERILQIAAVDGEAVVGRLLPDGVEIAVEFVAGRRDLDEFVQSSAPGETLYFGAFPARDNDSVNAVTLDLPDRDGVVPAHPH